VADDQMFVMDLQPDRENVSRARTFAVEHSASVGTDETTDVVELLVSELVTNAILHAGTKISLRLSYDDGLFRVGVRDASTAEARRRHCGKGATTGRGLELIEALASAWGVDSDAHGKTVWFTLRVEEPACPTPIRS
jgi:anti-sigma regulatory factor (Ser/Thr protein kinase)